MAVKYNLTYVDRQMPTDLCSVYFGYLDKEMKMDTEEHQEQHDGWAEVKLHGPLQRQPYCEGSMQSKPCLAMYATAATSTRQPLFLSFRNMFIVM